MITIIRKQSRSCIMLVWKNSYFTSVDIYMLGNECGMYQYQQFYDQHLEEYQLLPRPYLGSFEGGNRKKMTKKMYVRIGRSS